MEKEFNFSEKLKEFQEKKRQEEIQQTGIEGYCICCGATHYVRKEVEHDKECIWYEQTI
jgi:hypothetical protein